MQTSVIMHTCPCCRSTNDYTIVDMQLIDNDLLVTYQCNECSVRYTHTYALVYQGMNTAQGYYDRDNILMV